MQKQLYGKHSPCAFGKQLDKGTGYEALQRRISVACVFIFDLFLMNIILEPHKIDFLFLTNYPSFAQDN